MPERFVGTKIQLSEAFYHGESWNVQVQAF